LCDSYPCFFCSLTANLRERGKEVTARPNTGINVEGSNTDPEATFQMAQSICDVLQVAFETRQSEENINKALDLLANTTPINQVSLSDIQISGL
jgi:hypothetical protein